MPLALILQLSFRNLLRHRRRNGLLLAAVAVAVGSVLVTAALIRGFQVDLADAAVSNLTGHVKVQAPGYRDDPTIKRSFELGDAWQGALTESPVLGAAARVRVPAVVMSERETRGVQLVGVDPGAELISFLGDVSVRGEALTGADDRRLLIGQALAEQLKTDVGRRLVLMAQGSDGRSREAGFRIAGVYDGDGTSLEKAFLFTGTERLQAMLDTEAVTELSVRLDDVAGLDAEMEAVRQRLAEAYPEAEVLNWLELEPQAAAMFVYADTGIFIWFAVMMAALVFGLINTLITAVMERVRELGMLRAVGMRSGAVVTQVVIESTLIVTLGVAVGAVVGYLLTTLWLGGGIDLSQYAQGVEMVGMRSVLMPRIVQGDFVMICVLSVVVGVFASLYPARQAVKLSPLQALRAE